MFFFIIAIITLLHTILPAKSPIETDKNIIEISNSNTFDIDIEFIILTLKVSYR